jgi:hypothetical protein
MRERGTHFHNAARVLTDELLQWDVVEREEYEPLIAQFLFDFMRSACIDINEEQMRQGVRLHPRAMLRAVKDLDKWPEKPEEDAS